MKVIAALLVLSIAAAVVTAGAPVRRGPKSGGGHGDEDGEDVDVSANEIDNFKAKVQDLNLCECDAYNGFVAVDNGRIDTETVTLTVAGPPTRRPVARGVKVGVDCDRGAFIEFCFILDNTGDTPPATLTNQLGVLLDVHGACDNCNDIIAVQNGGVTITSTTTDKQVTGTLKVFFRDGFTATPSAVDALSLEEVLKRTNGRFFAQIFLVLFDCPSSTTVERRLGCATLTGTITAKNCRNKWSTGQNNICAGTQCSRGVKQRLGRAVAQAKTFDCCDDPDVFGCCSAAGKSDPSACVKQHAHHRCGPDAWKCDLSSSHTFKKQREFLTSPKSDWSGFAKADFGKGSRWPSAGTSTRPGARVAANSDDDGDDDRDDEPRRGPRRGG